MKKTLYLLPFALYTIFFLLIIFAAGGIESFVMPDVFLLLGLLLICGLGTLSKKKAFNAIGLISLFILSFELIKMGIENDYFVLAEAKIAIALLIYYLIAFIISKDKFLITMTGIFAGILLLLFVPIKVQYRDGGTVEYRAISYKYIKWNVLRNDGTYYEADDLYWFPKNFHSLEYYKPVETPVINVSVDSQQITCNVGSFHWSKTIDGESVMTIGDSFTNPVYMTYDDSLIITEDNILKFDTTYNISNVKYVEYKEEYSNSENVSENLTFNGLNLNSEDKTVDLKDFETGTYIISFKINNGNDYADYSFKVEVKK